MKKRWSRLEEMIWFKTRRDRLSCQYSSVESLSSEAMGDTSEPVVDVWEEGGAVFVEAEVAGVSFEDLVISVDSGRLIIEGMKKEPKDQDLINYLRVERQFGHFRRIIDLPSVLQTTGVKASVKDGILKICFSKVEERRRVKIRIPVTE